MGSIICLIFIIFVLHILFGKDLGCILILILMCMLLAKGCLEVVDYAHDEINKGKIKCVK